MKDLSKLQRLADHLVNNATELSQKYKKFTSLRIAKGNSLMFWDNVYYIILPWWEEELTIVFKHDFSRNYKNHVIYHLQPKISIPFVLPLYFNMPTEDYVHCFFIGQQNIEKFGGKPLTINSTPKECGLHLRAYIARKKNEWRREEEVLVRKVLVEKYTKRVPKIFTLDRVRADFED